MAFGFGSAGNPMQPLLFNCSLDDLLLAVSWLLHYRVYCNALGEMCFS